MWQPLMASLPGAVVRSIAPLGVWLLKDEEREAVWNVCPALFVRDYYRPIGLASLWVSLCIFVLCGMQWDALAFFLAMNVAFLYSNNVMRPIGKRMMDDHDLGPPQLTLVLSLK